MSFVEQRCRVIRDEGHSHSWKTDKSGGKLFLKSRLLNGILLWCCLRYILAAGAECWENEILYCSETVGFDCSQSPFACGFLVLSSMALPCPVELAPGQGHVPDFWSYTGFCFHWERSPAWMRCAGNSAATLQRDKKQGQSFSFLKKNCINTTWSTWRL